MGRFYTNLKAHDIIEQYPDDFNDYLKNVGMTQDDFDQHTLFYPESLYSKFLPDVSDKYNLRLDLNDVYRRLGQKPYHWELQGGKLTKEGNPVNTSQAGYIFIDDLIKQGKILGVPVGAGAGALALADTAQAGQGQEQSNQENNVIDDLLRGLGLGTRDVLTGMGNVADYTINPFANTANYMLGGSGDYFNNLGGKLSDYLNLPQAQTDTEKNISAFNQFASEVLPTLVTGLTLQSGAKSGTALKAILDDLAKNPSAQVGTAGTLGVILDNIINR